MGGIGPDVINERFGTSVLAMILFKLFLPTRNEDKPEMFFFLKILCILGFLKSPSINTTFLPNWQNDTARLIALVVLPSEGFVLEIEIILGGFPGS